ncbi:MAG: helix-turn-helix transcriptional regulator [Chloroflexi bacterium]|nr:helix-turn-helix transcriptional regulator [Chloroflexota bacterium]
MTSQNGRAFNEWLRAQLKAKKMSQRQLAQQSGVDHSTISRLIRGDRMPSLGTATKLARGLREIREDADTPQYLGLVTSGSANPTARVEYALRADEALGEPQVRQIMEYYLAVRMRRFGRVFHAADHTPSGTNGSGHAAGNETRSVANGTMGPRTAPGGSHGTADARPGPMPATRPTSYGSRSIQPSLMPRVGIATRVTSTPTLTRPTGRSSDRY